MLGQIPIGARLNEVSSHSHVVDSSKEGILKGQDGIGHGSVFMAEFATRKRHCFISVVWQSLPLNTVDEVVWVRRRRGSSVRSRVHLWIPSEVEYQVILSAREYRLLQMKKKRLSCFAMEKAHVDIEHTNRTMCHIFFPCRLPFHPLCDVASTQNDINVSPNRPLPP